MASTPGGSGQSQDYPSFYFNTLHSWRGKIQSDEDLCSGKLRIGDFQQKTLEAYILHGSCQAVLFESQPSGPMDWSGTQTPRASLTMRRVPGAAGQQWGREERAEGAGAVARGAPGAPGLGLTDPVLNQPS